MGCPMEEPYCEEWNEDKRICEENYPESCPNRIVCRVNSDYIEVAIKTGTWSLEDAFRFAFRDRKDR